MTTPAFVVCHDLLLWTQRTVAALEKVTDEVYLVDNASTYPPLLEWYESTPHTVVRLGANDGKLAPWKHGIIRRYAKGRRFLLTDPDVEPRPDCPSDWLARFSEVLDRYPHLWKVGFSLELSDLPDCYAFKPQVVAREKLFWPRRQLPHAGYPVMVDTTLALYRENARYCTGPAVRTPRPYTARHLAWYINSADPGEELLYYRAHADERFGHYAKAQLPQRLRENPLRGVKPRGPRRAAPTAARGARGRKRK